MFNNNIALPHLGPSPAPRLLSLQCASHQRILGIMEKGEKIIFNIQNDQLQIHYKSFIYFLVTKIIDIIIFI